MAFGRKWASHLKTGDTALKTENLQEGPMSEEDVRSMTEAQVRAWHSRVMSGETSKMTPEEEQQAGEDLIEAYRKDREIV